MKKGMRMVTERPPQLIVSLYCVSSAYLCDLCVKMHSNAEIAEIRTGQQKKAIWHVACSIVT
jgi:hypothetical protein